VIVNAMKSVMAAIVAVALVMAYFIATTNLADSDTGSVPVSTIEVTYQADVGDFVETELMCLAKNIYFEAGTESDAGKIAVALVTMNRVADNRWPSTICDVTTQGPTWQTQDGRKFPVKHRCQFSWYCDGKPDDPYPGKNWIKSQKIAETVYFTNRYDGLVENATHYHATYVQPNWSRFLDVVTQIDKHIFYR